jgi:hypothetical protein
MIVVIRKTKLLIGISVVALSINTLAQTVESTPAKVKQASVKEATAPTETDRLQTTWLEQAYALGTQVSEMDKAALLSRLVQTLARKQPEKAGAWAEEAFATTGSLTNDPRRGQIEMETVQGLASGDPAHAMKLLTRMSPPSTPEDGRPVMDMRAVAALPVYVSYWQKTGITGTEQISANARILGESGAYPLNAMGQIINQVKKKDSDVAKRLVIDAMPFMLNSNGGDRVAIETGSFLRNNQDLIGQAMMKDVLEKVVAKILNASPDNSYNGANISLGNDSGAQVRLKNSQVAALSMLMPLIRKSDPEWAKKLEDANQDLRAAANVSEKGNQMMAISIGGGPGGANAPSMVDVMKNRQIEEMMEQKPEDALKLANELMDPVDRTVASTKVAGPLYKLDPEKSRDIIKKTKATIAATADEEDKLLIIATVAQALKTMGDKDGFKEIFDQGYQLGTQMFKASVERNPKAPANNRPGYDDFAKLIQEAAAFNSSFTAQQIEAINIIPLKAMMYAEAADALDPKPAQQGGIVLRMRTN